MKNIVIALIIIFTMLLSKPISGQSKSENNFFNSFIFGSSLTLMGTGGYEPVSQTTWNINAATSVGKYFFSGVQVHNIFINADYFEERRLYNIYGLFTQFTPAPNSRFRPFFEISFNKGDYFFPHNSYYPAKNQNIFYIGIGGGADIPLKKISKHLFLDLSFIFYLQKENKWKGDNYNQYIIGLNYHFGKRVQEKWR